MKRWRIPRRFHCTDFADFVLNINDFYQEFMLVGVLEEYFHHFELQELHRISFDDVFRFLCKTCCIGVLKDEKVVRLNHERLVSLEMEVRKRVRRIKDCAIL